MSGAKPQHAGAQAGVDEVEWMLTSLARRWSDGGAAADAPARPHDPFNAVATSTNLAPTADGALRGVRLAVKDNVAVAGVPTALGSGLPGFVGQEDATLVARARAQGARVIAKAQCEAFLLGANSFTSRPAPVFNPYDLTRSAGGSSSGSAVMVAAAMADAAIGTDSGGSIRIPASFCGVVGFKPTRGRVPYTGIAPLEPFLEHAGPIGRDVVGVAALFAAIAGSDGVDPRCAWSPQATWRGPPAPVATRRVGVLREAAALAEPLVAGAFDVACRALLDSGIELVDISWPSMEEALRLHLAIYLTGQALVASAGGAPPGIAAGVPQGWADWRGALRDADLPPTLVRAIDGGQTLRSADAGIYARAVRRACDVARDLDRLFGGVGALALPTCANVAPPVPASEPSEDQIYGDTRLTAPFNVTGHPAISLPCGMAAGLPVGLQLVGTVGGDEALLALAAVVEAALPRTPSLPLNGAPA